MTFYYAYVIIITLLKIKINYNKKYLKLQYFDTRVLPL